MNGADDRGEKQVGRPVPAGETDVAERFGRLLALFRRPDGSEWGGAEIERASGGTVSRSYATNLKKGRIGSPGLDKLAAIADAMGFPPALWFGGDVGSGEGRDVEEAMAAALEDETIEAIVEEALRLGPGERKLLLGVARGMSASRASGSEDDPGNRGGPFERGEP